MKNAKNSKLFHFLQFFLLFVFVFSLSLNVKFYFENEILKGIVALELNTTKDEVTQLTSDLYEINKNADTNDTKGDDDNATR